LFAQPRLLRALVVALVLAGCVGDEAAMAEVNGHTYTVGPVRGLRISEAHLVFLGSVGRTNSEDYFLNGEVFTIDEVDPHTLLLVRAAPALPDDPWGDYVGLWGGGQDADLCGYIEASAVTFCK
jgi:hypothetical protein